LCDKAKIVTEEFKPLDSNRFETALRRLDEENARDPHTEQAAGAAHPRELLYAQWLTDWVLKLCPAGSEELRLAAVYPIPTPNSISYTNTRPL
jgi:hypothetical protein